MRATDPKILGWVGSWLSRKHQSQREQRFVRRVYRHLRWPATMYRVRPHAPSPAVPVLASNLNRGPETPGTGVDHLTAATKNKRLVRLSGLALIFVIGIFLLMLSLTGNNPDSASDENDSDPNTTQSVAQTDLEEAAPPVDAAGEVPVVEATDVAEVAAPDQGISPVDDKITNNNIAAISANGTVFTIDPAGERTKLWNAENASLGPITHIT